MWKVHTEPLQWWQWDPPSCIGKFKMLQFTGSCNTCHIVPLNVRSKKVNHMISVWCCVAYIKVKINKRYGVKFSRWSDFDENTSGTAHYLRGRGAGRMFRCVKKKYLTPPCYHEANSHNPPCLEIENNITPPPHLLGRHVLGQVK